MHDFTIGEIELLTGIKASVLRTWEQRFKIILPKRKENQRRFYEARDLKKLLPIVSLYKNRYPLTKLSLLSQQQLTELAKKIQAGSTDLSFFIYQLIEAALDFDEQEFRSVLNTAIEQIGVKKCIADVCYTYLVRLEQLAATNSLMASVLQFSIPLIQNRIITETEKLTVMHPGKPELLLLCSVRTSNELPLLFINYLLKANGWRTLYLGRVSSFDELKPVTHLPSIRYLYLHYPVDQKGPDADDYFETICKKLRTKKIIASGEGLQTMQRSFVNLTVLRTDQQIYDFIEGRNVNPQP